MNNDRDFFGGVAPSEVSDGIGGGRAVAVARWRSRSRTCCTANTSFFTDILFPALQWGNGNYYAYQMYDQKKYWGALFTQIVFADSNALVRLDEWYHSTSDDSRHIITLVSGSPAFLLL